MLAKHYDAIPSDGNDDVEEQTRPFQSPRGGLHASSSSANTKSSTNNIVSSFAMGCAVSLAAFGVASTALVVVVVVYVVRRWRIVCDDDDDERRRKRRRLSYCEHFSYPLNSDRRTYKGKSNEVYFNGQKYEKSKWKNGLIDTESVPYETANWVMAHPGKSRRMIICEFRRSGAYKNFRNSGRAIKKVAAKERRRRSVRF